MKIKILTVPTEIDASIVKGRLESENISAWIAPGEGSLSFTAGGRGPNVRFDVWIEDRDLDKAKEVIGDI